MAWFRCYDNSDVIATLIMTNFHLLWWQFFLMFVYEDVVTLKNCVEPPSYASTAYVVAIWSSFLFDSFVKIWYTCENFLGKWFTAPPGKKFPVRLWACRFLYAGFYCIFYGWEVTGGQWRHQTWSPSWKSWEKTARIGNFLCLACKMIHK